MFLMRKKEGCQGGREKKGSIGKDKCPEASSHGEVPHENVTRCQEPPFNLRERMLASEKLPCYWQSCLRC